MRLRHVAATFFAGVPVFLWRSHFRVDGHSMQPNLYHGDLLHVVPRAWMLHGFERGTVVVAKSPGSHGDLWVKRVIGLPGEFVSVTAEGVVRVDDAELSEPYRIRQSADHQRPCSWVCEDDAYFLLGDNRADSSDSRRYGPVLANNIVGKVWLRWPFRRGALMRRGGDP